MFRQHRSLNPWLILLTVTIIVGGSSPSIAASTDNPAAAAKLASARIVAPLDTLPRVATPHINFVTLLVSDGERALNFYTEVLGMKERGRAEPNERFREIVVGYDLAPLAAGLSLTYRNGPPNPRGNGGSSINLVVLELAKIMSKVVAAGGHVVQPLVRADLPAVSYSIARIQDLDGNALELVEYHRIGR